MLSGIVYSYSDATHISVPELRMTSWTGLSRHIKDAMIIKVGIHQTYASQTHESNLKSTFTTHWYAGGQSLVCGECIGMVLFVNILQGCIGQEGGGVLGGLKPPLRF